MKELIKGQQSTASQHRCAHLIRVGLFKRQILIVRYREEKTHNNLTVSDVVFHFTATPKLNKSNMIVNFIFLCLVDCGTLGSILL